MTSEEVTQRVAWSALNMAAGAILELAGRDMLSQAKIQSSASSLLGLANLLDQYRTEHLGDDVLPSDGSVLLQQMARLLETKLGPPED